VPIAGEMRSLLVKSGERLAICGQEIIESHRFSNPDPPMVSLDGVLEEACSYTALYLQPKASKCAASTRAPCRDRIPLSSDPSPQIPASRRDPGPGSPSRWMWHNHVWFASPFAAPNVCHLGSVWLLKRHRPRGFLLLLLLPGRREATPMPRSHSLSPRRLHTKIVVQVPWPGRCVRESFRSRGFLPSAEFSALSRAPAVSVWRHGTQAVPFTVLPSLPGGPDLPR